MTQPSTPRRRHSLQSIYDALQHRQRRIVLYHLRESPDGVAQFEAVTDRVAEWETADRDGSDADRDEERIAAILHHLHLPMLAECGIIDYDWRTKTIRYRPDDLLEAHLNLAEQRDLE